MSKTSLPENFTTEQPGSHHQRRRFRLIWMDGVERESLVKVRREIEDTVLEPPDRVEIDVWLESPGGDAHVAYKLALLLRSTASRIRVIVPDYAKSAATLIALVGDEIYMGPSAELGPLDAQMPEEGSLHGMISALNIARAADEVAREAVSLAGTGGAELLYRTGLSRAETLNAMLRFSASLSEPLVRQLDPKMVHQAKEMLRVTARYASRVLEDAGQPHSRAQSIATSLVENFPTHGFVISPHDATGLGLPVKDLADYDELDAIRQVHRGVEDGTGFVLFAEVPPVALDEIDLDAGLTDSDDDDQESIEAQHAENPSSSIPALSGPID